MILLGAMAVLGGVLGYVTPSRWGVFGFAGAAALLFGVFFGINAGTGYEGLPWEESLLFFNNELTPYLGYNAQITYRAFAIPVFCLGLVAILKRGRGL